MKRASGKPGKTPDQAPGRRRGNAPDPRASDHPDMLGYDGVRFFPDPKLREAWSSDDLTASLVPAGVYEPGKLPGLDELLEKLRNTRDLHDLEDF